MKTTNIILLSLLFATLISCGEEKEQNYVIEENSSSEEHSEEPENHELSPISLNDLQWMEGDWTDNQLFAFRKPPVAFREVWTYYPDSLSGRGYSIKEGDTTLTEMLSIRIVNDKLVYIANPVGQSLVSFPLDSIGDKYISFSNKAHDSPRDISYQFLTNDSLKVAVTSISPQGDRVVTFKMKRNSF